MLGTFCAAAGAAHPNSAIKVTAAVADIAEYPDSTYGVFIGFGADPNRVDELTGASYAIVDDLQSNGPTEEDMVKAHEKERRGREEALRTNEFWLSTLGDYAFDPSTDVTDAIWSVQWVQMSTTLL